MNESSGHADGSMSLDVGVESVHRPKDESVSYSASLDVGMESVYRPEEKGMTRIVKE